MANATSQVQSVVSDYTDTAFYWPLVTGATTARTYQTGEMIGLRSDGYAQAFDDSAALTFLGIVDGHPVQVTSTDGVRLVRLRRPYRIGIPLASGTVTRAGDIGKPLYANYSGTVQLAVTTYGNIAGTLVDVLGTSAPDAITGTIALLAPQGATVEAADVAALTDNSGGASADGTIGVVTLPTLAGWNGSTDPSAAEATQIITAVTACRDGLKELATKVNAILTALKAVGLMKSA